MAAIHVKMAAGHVTKVETLFIEFLVPENMGLEIDPASLSLFVQK